MSVSSEEKKTRLTGVELAKSDKGHCLFCDTRIAQDTPRVVWYLYHKPGAYSRNNGAASGYNSGGWMNLYAHPQCCFHYTVLMDSKNEEKKAPVICCSVCEKTVSDGRVVQTVTAKAKKRCRKNPGRPPIYHCFSCLRDFLTAHGQLLNGYLSPQQREESVAWAPPKSLWDPRTRDPVWHLPKSETVRNEYLALFDLSMGDDDKLDHAANSDEAAQHHVELQEVIGKAMKNDGRSDSTTSESRKKRKQTS